MQTISPFLFSRFLYAKLRKIILTIYFYHPIYTSLLFVQLRISALLFCVAAKNIIENKNFACFHEAFQSFVTWTISSVYIDRMRIRCKLKKQTSFTNNVFLIPSPITKSNRNSRNGIIMTRFGTL